MQMTRNNTILAILFFSLLASALRAQSNDECSTATVITDPTEFCTTAPGDDNTTATGSVQLFPSCWSNVGADVWYTFTAAAPDLVVIVKGLTPSNPAGTMSGPQVAVYSGDCSNLTEIGCAIDLNFTNNLPLVVHDLVVGQQYFIRIDGIVPGIFECCIKNKANVNIVSGDCPTATMITCKSPIVVDQVFDSGSDPDELSDAPCLTGFPGESSSAWYVFTAETSGKLEFTITPNAVDDDIDFVLYRLPNGPGDCTGKIVERCMVAGDFDASSPCMGPTGLNSTATDISQPPGCAPGQDNFLRFLNLVAGRTYALIVNNFTTIGNGYTLDWGGTAKFQGAPVANFSTDEPDKKLCLGEELILTDSSYTTDSTAITNWHWDFGPGAIPDTINGQGPQTVQYQSVGPKSIFLTITTENGCIAMDTALLLVEFCCTLDAEVSVKPGCPYAPTATATVDIQNSLDPLMIAWTNSTSTSDTAKYANSGTYTVLVVDANGCRDSTTFTVNTPLNVSAVFPPDTSTIVKGAPITLSVSGVPKDSLMVNWDNLASSELLTGAVQPLTPEETVTYLVTVNNSGCTFTDSVTVIVRDPQSDIPNAFTPNGDGANDTFGPVLFGRTLVQLEVWSRWGDKIFDSLVDGRDTWDGTINGLDAPSDVYVYRATIKLETGEETVEKGDVTLLR